MNLGRLRRVWKRIFSLAWPVMAEQTAQTAMRTVDVAVTAALSPAAVVAIGLADLYARFPLRIGLGLGGGAIALSSQDTGSGADANRSEAISTALLLAFLAGVPFLIFGFTLGEAAIGAFPASDRAVALGTTYLAVIFATSPARLVSLVGSRSLQGVGDTRTPMLVNVFANVVNIGLSVGLGFGLVGLPALGVLGVGLATSTANVLSAGLLLAALARPASPTSLVRPRDRTVASQLVRIATPRVGEGLAAELAEFPFNALLLGFGDAVNAGFQIGRRVYQQVASPLARGYNVAASVLVGQALGAGDSETARYQGGAVALLSVATVGGIGLFLAAFTEPIVGLVGSGGGADLEWAVKFAVAYGLAAPGLALFVGLSGSLQGAGATRIPFVARLTGVFGFFVGASYLLVEVFDYGPLGARIGIVLSFTWMGLFALVAFYYADWAGHADSLMVERGSVGVDDAGEDD
ncbi:DNA damage-inducible protein [Haloferax gibbonsii ATCC 33959]|uniref:Multidrug-efflux transporter n=1 Tax=Haloferax gibbonsii (strain ATCC 33959 / DSM 4427 / JCM 8863 / NBRC 102184 / NCIMB 2188 / Ma 2.38) TaxID=1227459 RepID=M0HGQ8_HALGM|nr:MATE family efflux transporter [Haloferax gibbonsii]ELZ83725.1 DNA damage-inducible protein [Haloferax gibbonsii ATCC 33959]